MIAERVLQSYQNKIKIHSIRPATVCGYSPRMRLDVSVNMFIYQALVKKIDCAWWQTNKAKYKY